MKALIAAIKSVPWLTQGLRGAAANNSAGAFAGTLARAVREGDLGKLNGSLSSIPGVKGCTLEPVNGRFIAKITLEDGRVLTPPPVGSGHVALQNAVYEASRELMPAGRQAVGRAVTSEDRLAASLEQIDTLGGAALQAHVEKLPAVQSVQLIEGARPTVTVTFAPGDNIVVTAWPIEAALRIAGRLAAIEGHVRGRL